MKSISRPIRWNTRLYSHVISPNICQVSDLESVEDKLSWIFTAFDSDGGGSIDYDEITDICQGLFRLAGIEEDEDMLASCVADVRSEDIGIVMIIVNKFFAIDQRLTVMVMETYQRKNLSRMGCRANSSQTY